MLRYYAKKPRLGESSTSTPSEIHLEEPPIVQTESPPTVINDSTVKRKKDPDLPDLPSDPALRIKISDYDSNIRDRVRRHYLLEGPCQPSKHNFKMTKFGKTFRRFVPYWFKEYSWLEYSVTKEAAYCFYCYLFKDERGNQGGGDTFVGEGFTNWKKKERFLEHEGGPNSSHFKAYEKSKNLIKQEQHIKTTYDKMTYQVKHDYRLQLASSIKCGRFLLHHGLPFRGHDETKDSNNKGLFIDLLQFLADNNEEVSKVVLDNAEGNLKLIAPSIQKDIVKAIARETTKLIIKELDGGLFSILIDEARDVSTQEQMAIVLRFVDKKGCVVERFLGLKKVANTTAKSLKKALDDLFSKHSLSISMLRGQGYDGASNMRGEYNGLKALILKENESAHYIHCFAHQLQLALVGVAKKHSLVNDLFFFVSDIVNTIGGSCKKKDMLRDAQAIRIFDELANEEIVTGRGLNQESCVVRPGDTRWGSHYRTLGRLINLFGAVVDVLDEISNDESEDRHKYVASLMLTSIQSFDFVFTLHLMENVLGITNDLSQALQRKDQDIENAIRLVDISKRRLQKLRDDGWDSLVEKVSIFCEKNNVSILIMEDAYIVKGKSLRRAEKMTNFHHYRVELFNSVIDMQLQELNHRFTESSTELLLCIACLDPHDSFSSFDIGKLIRFAKFYPKDFSDFDLLSLSNQLENFIMDMRSNVDLMNIKGISDVTRMMVESKRDLTFPLVYKLLSLALILPVATATVERAFSGMKIVKTRLRNRMNNEWLSNSLLVYIEKDLCTSLPDEVIMKDFQTMAERRGQL